MADATVPLLYLRLVIGISYDGIGLFPSLYEVALPEARMEQHEERE